MRKPGDVISPLADRFYAKVSPEALTGCWLWVGAVKEFGYGVIGLGTREQGVAKAHRVSYELHKGPIPAGLNVLHQCDNPACVNPNHLYAGTLSENMADCKKRGRLKTPDNRGEKAKWHKLTAANVAEVRTRLMTSAQYAKKFSVSRSAICNIWSKNSWANA